jgi:GLPGLI family protein
MDYNLNSFSNPLMFKLLFLIHIITGIQLYAQNNPKSILITYDGYQYPNGNEFKTIDTRTTLTISGSKSTSFDSSLPVVRPLADSGNIYAKMKRARVIYKDRSSKSLIFESRNFLVDKTNIPISDTLFQFQWHLTSQSKLIESYICIKAICLWRGRAFSAWFTEDIPISEGPWKFGGLPGLIVELYDEEKNFYWKLSGMKEIPFVPIEMPASATNYATVVEAFAKEAQKRIAAARAQLQQINPGCKDCNQAATLSYPTLENWADRLMQ